MTILVQRTDTCEFYGGDMAWTRHIKDAFDFKSVDDAQEFCRGSDIEHCAIIVHLPDGVHDVKIPCESR